MKSIKEKFRSKCEQRDACKESMEKPQCDWISLNN
jgi:hypothetical protein